MGGVVKFTLSPASVTPPSPSISINMDVEFQSTIIINGCPATSTGAAVPLWYLPITEEIVPSLIIDEEKYQAVFQSKLIQQKFFKPKRKVVFVFKTDDAIVDELNNEVKMFLYEAYKGHCQLCGFTFKKIRDQRNSFEKFNWNDKRIVKVEKKFISSADSLCLCRNCVANIKFGDFEPEFIEKIKAIENFESKDFEQIISLLQSTAENNIPKIFENHVLFDDIVPLEIKLNKEAKRLYFTREHLLQFIVFLQMEKGYI